MNQPAPLLPDDDASPPAPLSGEFDGEEVFAALRLPGLLGRPRPALPVAPGAPPVPAALSAFNRLTGRLDQGPPERPGGGEVVTELSGLPVRAVREGVSDGRA